MEEFNVVKEGAAEILCPKEDKVFYNNIQQFNRDLSVMVIKSWDELYGSSMAAKKREITGDRKNYINILEALSATGLRACRYGKEVDNVNKVVANDLLPEAVKLINSSINHNNLSHCVQGNLLDANKYMSSTNTKFHVVDLDPYGTAIPFIDGAIKCLRDGGIMMITCTDAGVLAGSGYPEKCFSLYGGNNFGNTFIGSESNHEVGIRLALQKVASIAAQYKKTIEPLLCLSIDYYFRLFIKVNTSAASVKDLASNTLLTYHCIGCGNKTNQYLGRKVPHKSGFKYQTPKSVINRDNCEFCQSNINIAGPMYGGEIHNHQFINKILEVNEKSSNDIYKTRERIKGMLTLAKNELSEPFYFNLNQISSFFKSPPISINEFNNALGNLGYKISLTHAKKNCIKTDAPWEVILMINKCWLIKNNLQLVKDFDDGKLGKTDKNIEKIKLIKENNSNNINLNENMIGYKILNSLQQMDLQLEVDFDKENDESIKVKKLRNLKMVRYQENPSKNWGPKAKPRD